MLLSFGYMLTDQGGQSTFFVCSDNLTWKKEMGKVGWLGGGGSVYFPVPSWIKPVYSGLLFLPTHSSPPTLIPLLYTDTDFYAQLCSSIVVMVYMRFISWLLLPQSTADRPTHWTCPPFVSLLYYCCPILFLFKFEFVHLKIEN